MTTNIDLAAAKRFLSGVCGGQPVSVLCAVSGGLDSMCLLHLLTTWGRENGIAVTAAHFNHQLRFAESDRDEAFVRDWCAEHGVPCVFGRGDVRAFAAESGQSIEEAARTLRYAFLEEQKQALNCTFILTAHHADDNAETMLLNLLRGTGLPGLCGIPENRDGIARPFLSVTRAELAAYAQKYNIKYVEDSTNALDDAARNVLRHQVLPVLRELNPRAVENMARTARLLRRDEETLTRGAEELLEQCRPEENGLAIDVNCLREAESALRKRAVHGMLARAAGRRKNLTARHVEAVCALLDGDAGKEVSLPYGLTARRTHDALVVTPAAEPTAAKALTIGETVAFGCWQVCADRAGPGLEIFVPEGAALAVTGWGREDRMTLPGSRGARSLKRLCSERGVSPAERDALPVLRVDGRCAAVPGVGVDMEFLPRRETEAVWISFQKNTEEKHDEK